jgi:hypothetical protein
VIVNPPVIEEFDATASDPFERLKLAWLVRLLTESEPEPEWVTVMPDMLIATSSDGPGTEPLLQLDGVSQSPPAGSLHVTVARSVRSSSWLTAGWKDRRGPHRRIVATDVPNEGFGRRADSRRMVLLLG